MVSSSVVPSAFKIKQSAFEFFPSIIHSASPLFFICRTLLSHFNFCAQRIPYDCRPRAQPTSSPDLEQQIIRQIHCNSLSERGNHSASDRISCSTHDGRDAVGLKPPRSSGFFYLISLAALIMVEQYHLGKVLSSFPRSVCVVRGRRP